MKRHGEAAAWAASLVLHAGLLAGAVATAALVRHPAWLVAGAALAAFASVQIGYLGHDLEHGQVLRRGRTRDALALLCWNLLLGVSAHWWRAKHVAHHAHTHVPGRDPDLYALLGHDGADPSSLRPAHRWLVAHQHWLFWPVTGLARLHYQLMGAAHAWRLGGARGRLEFALLALHHAALVGAACWWLGAGAGLAFVALSTAMSGLYMGLAFATNHLGMPTAAAPGSGRLWQLAHTRNVRTGPLGDYLLGGLNLQIEHHLYPSLPRSRLRGARAETRRRCAEHGIGYHETSLWRALAEVQASLRRSARAAAP